MLVEPPIMAFIGEDEDEDDDESPSQVRVIGAEIGGEGGDVIGGEGGDVIGTE